MKQTTAMPMLRVQTPMAASHALVIPVTAEMAQHALVTLIFMAQLVCLLLLQHVTYYPTAHI